jgi:hypothetical protein
MAELSQLHFDFLACSKAVRALHFGWHGLLLETANVSRVGTFAFDRQEGEAADQHR